jgi:hypothetical protein
LGELLKTCDDPISTDTVVWAIRRVHRSVSFPKNWR